MRLRDGRVTIRPLAGTRPRGETAAEDKALAEDLLADPKELAEHLMLLDLGRNDVGRVSKVGTVQVTDRMEIEHYSHVMHIVSNVEGELDDSHDAVADASQEGVTGLYRHRFGDVSIDSADYECWLDNSSGLRHDAFLEQLIDSLEATQASVWTRQMGLSPAPEFCVLSATPLPLKADGFLALHLERVWPDA